MLCHTLKTLTGEVVCECTGYGDRYSAGEGSDTLLSAAIFVSFLSDCPPVAAFLRKCVAGHASLSSIDPGPALGVSTEPLSKTNRGADWHSTTEVTLGSKLGARGFCLSGSRGSCSRECQAAESTVNFWQMKLFLFKSRFVC